MCFVDLQNHTIQLVWFLSEIRFGSNRCISAWLCYSLRNAMNVDKKFNIHLIAEKCAVWSVTLCVEDTRIAREMHGLLSWKLNGDCFQKKLVAVEISDYYCTRSSKAILHLEGDFKRTQVCRRKIATSGAVTSCPLLYSHFCTAQCLSGACSFKATSTR